MLENDKIRTILNLRSNTKLFIRPTSDYKPRQEHQRICKLISSFRYFTDLSNFSCESVDEIYTKSNILYRFSSKFNSTAHNYFSSWISYFVSKPEKVARAVSAYYWSNKEELLMFSRMTLPNLYFCFVTQEYLIKGFAFLSHLIRISSESVYQEFVLGFLLSFHQFSNAFVYDFLEKWNGMRRKNELSAIYNCLKCSLRNCLYSLPVQVIDIFKDIYSINKESAQKVLLLFLRQIVTEGCVGTRKGIYYETIDNFFGYSLGHLDSPHSRMLLNIVIENEYSSFVPNHAFFSDETRAPIVLYVKECCFIYDFILKMKDSLEIEMFSKINLAGNSISQYDMVFIEIPSHSILKPTDAFIGTICYENQKYIDIEPLSDESRFWNSLNQRINSIQFDILDLLKGSIPPQLKDQSATILKWIEDPHFLDYAKSMIIKESNGVINGIESHFKTSLICQIQENRYYHALNVLQRVLHIAIRLTMQPGVFMSLKPEHNTFDPFSYSYLRDVYDYDNSEIPDRNNVYDSGCFTRFGLPLSPHELTNSIQPDISSLRPSTFDMGNEVVVKTEPPPRRNRRNSENEGNSIAFLKKSITQVLAKVMNSELKVWIILGMLDSWKGDDKNLESLSREYTNRMNSLRIQSFSDVLSEEESHEIQRVSNKFDSIGYYDKGSSIIEMIRVFSELSNTSNRFWKKDSSMRLQVFRRIMLNANSGVFESFFWFNRLKFLFEDFKSFPAHLTGSINLINDIFPQFLKDLSPKFAELCSKSYSGVAFKMNKISNL